MAKTQLELPFQKNEKVKNGDVTPRVIGLFAGCGGLDYGFKKALITEL